MARRPRQRKKRPPMLLQAGLQALLLGGGLLVAPTLLPMLAPSLQALRPLGWGAVALGALFVFLAPRSRRGRTTAPQSKNVVVALRAAKDAPASPGVPPPRQAHWSPAVFAAIEWRRFEAVCETLFQQAGFRTRAQSHGADGGVDIWMFSDHAEGPVAVAQCKHWRNQRVGVKELREFFGVMASHGLRRGTFVTTSIFTPEALVFATDNGINALDGTRLLRLIAERTPAQQQALLDVAYKGDYHRPTCARCGTKMVERDGGPGRAPFWGCARFPACRSTLRMAR
ncbi:restriction endonuclease [uncultured Xylophilus sp.]|uniref:restriction endonuclease n=1 Tax=uncultured Xylophilus sp. TaxID=296832 RepID=UPI0025FBF3E8|nr:restriction endonuclease [uncultured Xylophilus sp.]